MSELDAPYIDPDVKHVGINFLRSFNKKTLSSLDKVLVIQGKNYEPIAVLMSYDNYIKIQQELVDLIASVDGG